MPDLDHQWTWARYKTTNEFKPAEILVKFAYENKQPSYNVKFEDGSEETVTDINMFNEYPKYTVGQHLVRAALYSEYGATLKEITGQPALPSIADYEYIYTVKKIWVRGIPPGVRPVEFMYNMQRRTWKVDRSEMYHSSGGIREHYLLPMPHRMPKYLVGDIVNINNYEILKGKVIQRYILYDDTESDWKIGYDFTKTAWENDLEKCLNCVFTDHAPKNKPTDKNPLKWRGNPDTPVMATQRKATGNVSFGMLNPNSPPRWNQKNVLRSRSTSPEVETELKRNRYQNEPDLKDYQREPPDDVDFRSFDDVDLFAETPEETATLLREGFISATEAGGLTSVAEGGGYIMMITAAASNVGARAKMLLVGGVGLGLCAFTIAGFFVWGAYNEINTTSGADIATQVAENEAESHIAELSRELIGGKGWVRIRFTKDKSRKFKWWNCVVTRVLNAPPSGTDLTNQVSGVDIKYLEVEWTINKHKTGKKIVTDQRHLLVFDKLPPKIRQFRYMYNQQTAAGVPDEYRTWDVFDNRTKPWNVEAKPADSDLFIAEQLLEDRFEGSAETKDLKTRQRAGWIGDSVGVSENVITLHYSDEPQEKTPEGSQEEMTAEETIAFYGGGRFGEDGWLRDDYDHYIYDENDNAVRNPELEPHAPMSRAQMLDDYWGLSHQDAMGAGMVAGFQGMPTIDEGDEPKKTGETIPTPAYNSIQHMVREIILKYPGSRFDQDSGGWLVDSNNQTIFDENRNPIRDPRVDPSVVVNPRIAGDATQYLGMGESTSIDSSGATLGMGTIAGLGGELATVLSGGGSLQNPEDSGGATLGMGTIANLGGTLGEIFAGVPQRQPPGKPSVEYPGTHYNAEGFLVDADKNPMYDSAGLQVRDPSLPPLFDAEKAWKFSMHTEYANMTKLKALFNNKSSWNMEHPCGFLTLNVDFKYLVYTLVYDPTQVIGESGRQRKFWVSGFGRSEEPWDYKEWDWEAAKKYMDSFIQNAGNKPGEYISKVKEYMSSFTLKKFTDSIMFSLLFYTLGMKLLQLSRMNFGGWDNSVNMTKEALAEFALWWTFPLLGTDAVRKYESALPVYLKLPGTPSTAKTAYIYQKMAGTTALNQKAKNIPMFRRLASTLLCHSWDQMRTEVAYWGFQTSWLATADKVALLTIPITSTGFVLFTMGGAWATVFAGLAAISYAGWGGFQNATEFTYSMVSSMYDNLSISKAFEKYAPQFSLLADTFQQLVAIGTKIVSFTGAGGSLGIIILPIIGILASIYFK